MLVVGKHPLDQSFHAWNLLATFGSPLETEVGDGEPEEVKHEGAVEGRREGDQKSYFLILGSRPSLRASRTMA